jgi:hypothetical protein
MYSFKFMSSACFSIPAGAPSTAVVLHAVPNVLMHRGEKAILNLAAGTGYKIGRPNRATVTIH